MGRHFNVRCKHDLNYSKYSYQLLKDPVSLPCCSWSHSYCKCQPVIHMFKPSSPQLWIFMAVRHIYHCFLTIFFHLFFFPSFSPTFLLPFFLIILLFSPHHSRADGVAALSLRWRSSPKVPIVMGHPNRPLVWPRAVLSLRRAYFSKGRSSVHVMCHSCGSSWAHSPSSHVRTQTESSCQQRFTSTDWNM